MVAMMTTAMRMIVLTMTETMTIATTMIATMMIVMTAIGTAMKATTMIVMTMNDSNYNDGNEDNSNEHCHQKQPHKHPVSLINDIENWPSHNCKQLPNLAHGRKTHQPWYHWQPQHPYLFLCHSCKLDASTLHLNWPRHNAKWSLDPSSMHHLHAKPLFSTAGVNLALTAVPYQPWQSTIVSCRRQPPPSLSAPLPTTHQYTTTTTTQPTIKPKNNKNDDYTIT